MEKELPGIDNTPTFAESVPGVQFPFRQEFARRGMAIEHLGESIEQGARTGGEIYDEIQRQHDISTSSQGVVDAGVAHAQQLQDLKLTSPDGFVHGDDGVIEKNKDGSQRTISQQYWDWANDDYLNRQSAMSSRAAAMFRQQMLPEIGRNTTHLQSAQLLLQRGASDQALAQSMGTMSHDNDRSPWPDQNPYYLDRNEDGSPNLRGSTAKIEDQLRTIKLWTARQGPLGDQPGIYNPSEVSSLSAQRMADHSESWMRSAVTDIMENDSPRDRKNHVSGTALQQVKNLRDIVEGADPQSKASAAKGLPTVNSSLGPDRIDKWRNQLNAMMVDTKKVDRSDYEFSLDQMKAAAKVGYYATPEKLFGSPEFSHLVHAAEPLGLTPEEQLRNFSGLFTEAAVSSVGGPTFDLSSETTKQKLVTGSVGDFAKAWPQYGQMLGAKYTGEMANAVIADATKGSLAKIEEQTRQFKEDPAKFAAGEASGYQNPMQPMKYRSPIMKNVADQLFSDSSLFAPLNPLKGTGKPLILSAANEMTRIGHGSFGQGYEPSYLSKSDYENWANKIKNGTPEQVSKMFDQLDKVMGPKSGAVVDQLVHVGNMPPDFQTARLLTSETARREAYGDILSKNAAVKMLAESQNGEDTKKAIHQRMSKLAQPWVDFNNGLFGADQPQAARANQAILDTLSNAYAKARLNGIDPDGATQAAKERVLQQNSPIGIVQDQHKFLGLIPMSAGPASRVMFSRPDLSVDQQQTIQQSLLRYQKIGELSKFEVVQPPTGVPGLKGKFTAQWVAEHPLRWYPVRAGSEDAAYRLQYQGMNADGSPSGQGYDLRVHAPDGSERYYEVKESDALKKGP